jgi:hypothetical protein
MAYSAHGLRWPWSWWQGAVLAFACAEHGLHWPWAVMALMWFGHGLAWVAIGWTLQCRDIGCSGLAIIWDGLD